MSSDLAVLDQVVVMDNDAETLKAYKKALKEIGFGKVYAVDNRGDALKLLNKSRKFILDIHMGEEREEEGLDVLETLKARAEGDDLFVGILSNHPSQYERRAKRLKADTFRSKTFDLRSDMCEIVKDMMEQDDLIASSRTVSRLVIAGIETIKQEGAGGQSVEKSAGAAGTSDANYQAFQRALRDAAWVKEHYNNYVAVVGGKVRGTHESATALLKRVRARFPARPIFIKKVEGDEEAVEIPGPFSVADLEEV